MSNFALALKSHLESLPGGVEHLGVSERRAYRIVSNPATFHNARVLARWESASAEELNLSGIIDWFKQNWKTILQVVLSILGLLLMFETHPVHEAIGAEPGESNWFPGKFIIKQIAPALIEQYATPTFREMFPDAPGSDAEWSAMFLDKFRKGQERSS